MKQTLSILLLLVVASALVFAGGQGEESGAMEQGGDQMVAAMATDVGGLGDKSFNDGAYQGLQMGEDLGFEARVVESNQQTDYIPNLTGLAEDGADIVFAVGFLMEQAVNLLDKLTSKFMLPLTGLGAILFAGWFLNREGVAEDLGLSGGKEALWVALTRFVAPIGVAVVFISSL